MRGLPLARTRPDAAAPAARTVRTLMSAAVFALGAVLIGALGAGSTFAFLNSSQAASTQSTVAAGTASFTVTQISSFSSTVLVPISGSNTTTASWNVTNTGDVKLTVAPTATLSSTGSATFRDNTTLSLGFLPVGSVDCGAVTYTWSKTGSAAASGSLGTIDARDRFTGATGTVTQKLCARIQLSTSAPASAAGGTATYTVTLDGTQAW